jgi:hypothetical protein
MRYEEARNKMASELPLFDSVKTLCPKCGYMSEFGLTYHHRSQDSYNSRVSYPECMEHTCGVCGWSTTTRTKDAG